MTTIRIAVASDLHFEWMPGGVPDISLEDLHARADLFLAVGDIHVGSKAKDWLFSSLVPTIYVPGNHEYYNQNMSRMRSQAWPAWNAQEGHVQVLDPGVREFAINGAKVRVVGATLWTDYCLHGEVWQFKHMQIADQGLNDHRLIHLVDDDGWKPNTVFSPYDALRHHQRERAFIEDELAKPFDGATIVATHHAASPEALAPEFDGDKLSPAYASNLEHIMKKADFWASGHTHHPIDMMIGSCHFVSNPRGYGKENPGYVIRVYDLKVQASHGPTDL